MVLAVGPIRARSCRCPRPRGMLPPAVRLHLPLQAPWGDIDPEAIYQIADLEAYDPSISVNSVVKFLLHPRNNDI